MGAWRAGLLEDDAALDFLQEALLPAADPRSAMGAAFRAVLEADYVEFDMGHGALVSAVVIRAVLRGEPLNGVDNEGEAGAIWFDGLSSLDFSSLRSLAARACRRVMAEQSELYELWPENEAFFPVWRDGVMELVRSLESVD